MDHGSLKIMIVDDELFFRKLLRDILSRGGFTNIVEAVNGEEAIDVFRNFRPHITFTDIFMPEKNGIEAIKEIMAIDSNARIIVCSAAGFDDELQIALSVGAKATLLKPYMIDELKVALRTALLNSVKS